MNAYRSIIVAEDVMMIFKEKKEREKGFSKYVFSSPGGGPISPDSVLNMLHRVLKRAGKGASFDLNPPCVSNRNPRMAKSKSAL